MQGLRFVSRVQQLILHVVGLTDDVAVQLTEAIPQGQVFRVVLQERKEQCGDQCEPQGAMMPLASGSQDTYSGR